MHCKLSHDLTGCNGNTHFHRHDDDDDDDDKVDVEVDVDGGWDEDGDVGGDGCGCGGGGGGGGNGQGGDGDVKIKDKDDDQWDADGECDDLVGNYNKYTGDENVDYTDGSGDDNNPNVGVNDVMDCNGEKYVGNSNCEVKRGRNEGIYIDSHSERSSDSDNGSSIGNIVGEEVNANKHENKSSNCVYEEISGIQPNDLKNEEAYKHIFKVAKITFQRILQIQVLLICSVEEEIARHIKWC